MRTLLLMAGVLFGVLSAQSQSVDVTFKVDMSTFTGTIDASGMHIAGSFPTGTWTPSERPMTNEGDGIWSYTESLPEAYALEYKFVLGNDWAFGDENVGGQSCAAPSSSNRALTVPAANTVLDPVCFGSCNVCSFEAATVNITFQVDMSQQTIDFDNGGVSLSGTFNGFAKEPMVDQGGGVYAVTVELEEGTSVQYKFRNGDAFENPFGACASGDFGNRVLAVPSEDASLDVVCYASCEACTTPGQSYDVTFQVNASQIAVNELGLHIAGTFNGFTPAPMTDLGDGLYSFTANIEEGSTILWKYLNGNSFDNVEIVPEECGNDDGFGGFNRIATGPSADTVLDVVCFGSCTAECPGTGVCEANGGTLEASGSRSFCVGTGSPVGIDITAVGAVGTFQRWALIDSDGEILATRSNNSNFNLDIYPAGNYSIRYIKFEADVDLTGITNVSQAGSLTGCFSLSTNSIQLFLRSEPTAGTLTALSPTTVCANAGPNTGIQVGLSGFDGENLRYGLVSQSLNNQVVDQLAGTPAGATFNLNGLAPGTYRVFALSYQTGVSLTGVQFASDLAGCFDLSNPVTVTVEDCPAAIVTSSPNPTSAQSFVTFVNPREEYTTLEVYDMSGRMVERLFNQVTAPGQAYRLEFNGASLPNGVYLYRLTSETEVVVDKFMVAK